MSSEILTEEDLMLLNDARANSIDHTIGKLSDKPNCMFNYVLQNDGVYLIANTDLAQFRMLIAKNTTDLKLPIVVTQGFTLSIPKVPEKIFTQILAWFKEVYAELKTEAYVRVYYSKSKNTFMLYIPQQTVQSANVKFDKISDPKLVEFDTNEDLVLVLQVHSHHVMSGVFSGQDDSDDIALEGFYMVIGNILSVPTYQIRFCMENVKVPVSFNDIFATTAPGNWSNNWRSKLLLPSYGGREEQFVDEEFFNRGNPLRRPRWMASDPHEAASVDRDDSFAGYLT